MIRGVLCDLSGVLYVGDEAIEGAKQAIETLRRRKMPLRFVTNVTRRPAHALRSRLARMGLPIGDEELITAPRAARAYLVRHELLPHLLVHPALEDEFSDLVVDDTPTAVLVGDAGDDFNYASLNRAFRLLMDGAALLAMGNNRYFRDRDGLSLDIGPFVAALEYASGKSAVILGKPSKEFFLAAVDSLGCAPGEAVMVGDDALADVDGALAAGIAGILVKTGKYRPGDEGRITKPGAEVVDDVAAAAELILRQT
ncbi:MAG: TIGR01458 family HAD-type hydrolase [Gammaproteobacteria bacterium]|nr:TIGR01458 family HAD-type hydrolase [Gammaproteobacteria bacterium]